MSTKPPTAVMMPSVSSAGFKAVLDLFEACRPGAKLLRSRIVGLLEERGDFVAVGRVRLVQRGGRSLDFLAQPVVHAEGVGLGQLTLAGLIVDQCPFGRSRPRLLDIFEVRIRPLGAGGQREREQQGPAHAGTTVPLADRSVQVEAAILRPLSERARKVIEKRSWPPGVIRCSQSQRASPERR